MARVEEFYEQADVIHRDGCSVCIPIEGYQGIAGYILTGINSVRIIEVPKTYDVVGEITIAHSRHDAFLPPIDDFRLRYPHAKLIGPRWWQWRKHRRWANMPKITDNSIAGVLRGRK